MDPLPTTPAHDGGNPAPKVAPVRPPGETGNAPLPAPATPSVSSFGGKPSGRPLTKYQFPPDTEEGKAERREDNRIRKAKYRESLRKAALAQPEPLPPLPASAMGPVQAPDGDAASLASAPVFESIPWTAADVREFTDELVELSEAKRVADFCAIAREAKLPASLVNEIERDAKFPTKSKTGLKAAIAAVSAKWLNRVGVSARNKEEAALLFFSAGIWLQGRRLKSHLQSLVAEAQTLQPVKAPAKPAGTAPPNSHPKTAE